jgi:hypothetical protein
MVQRFERAVGLFFLLMNESQRPSQNRHMDGQGYFTQEPLAYLMQISRK